MFFLVHRSNYDLNYKDHTTCVFSSKKMDQSISDWSLTHHQILHNTPDTYPNPPHFLPLQYLLVLTLVSHLSTVPDSSY